MSLSKVKVFKAFNCTDCKKVIAFNQDSPNLFQIDLRRKVLCQNCYNLCASISCGKTGCHHATSITYILRDLLASGCLRIDTKGNGYSLVKPVTIPECPVCHEEFTGERDDRIPVDLFCRHTLCLKCHRQLKTANQDGTYNLNCPICQRSYKTCRYAGNRPLIQFLRELPTIVMQIDKELRARYKEKQECSKCQKDFPIEEAFHCDDCNMNICATCTVLDHRTHQLRRMVVIEAKRISEECHGIVENQISTYEQTFPMLHRETEIKIGKIKDKILEKIVAIAELKKIDEVKKWDVECQKIGKEFEEISEQYLPQLRDFETKLQKLCEKLEKLEKLHEKRGAEGCGIS